LAKLDLNRAAGEFEAISDDCRVFFNKVTSEFDFWIDPTISGVEDDGERFDGGDWIAAPCQRDLGEYDIMVDFTDTVTDPRKNELLNVALEGKGAFRRFKDTLRRAGLTEEWYAFKRQAFVEIAKEWCEDNGIEYTGCAKPQNEPLPEQVGAADFIVIPFHPRMTEDAAEILREVLGWSKACAASEIKRMSASSRILLAALTDDMQLAGIIGAIPQYGSTGWELHPLAVRKEYQRKGIGRALVEALECEVAERGGVTLYLGSDDESGTTSLYGADLYEDTFGKLANIRNTGGHPYPFYEKLGYKIVGVLPDVNGIGKPDIWMAKRIRRKRS
jgi:aminoglycoside 6'-N-acetyltransferase I